MFTGSTFIVSVTAALDSQLWVRIDAAGDYTEFLADVLTFANTVVLTKARITPELLGAIAGHATWRTVGVDANDVPTVQVATVDHPRPCWRTHGLTLRVAVVRSLIRACGQPGATEGELCGDDTCLVEICVDAGGGALAWRQHTVCNGPLPPPDLAVTA